MRKPVLVLGQHFGESRLPKFRETNRNLKYICPMNPYLQSILQEPNLETSKRVGIWKAIAGNRLAEALNWISEDPKEMKNAFWLCAYRSLWQSTRHAFLE